jgi:hypothetical protein
MEKQSDDNSIRVKWKQIHWRVAAVLPPPPESTPTANHTLVINSSRLTFGESEKQSDVNIICVTRKQIHRRAAAVLPPPPESTPTTNHTLVINSTNSVTEESLPIIGLSPAPIAQNLNTSSSITEDHQSSTTFVAPSQDTLLTTSLIRSREKSDSLHEHYNVPLKKDSPVSPFVHQLLKHATFAMNAAKEDNVQQVLASKGVTVTDFDENFFFNKEYWYKRVRMVPKEPDEASAIFLLAVLDFLESRVVFKNYVTPELKKHILSWALLPVSMAAEYSIIKEFCLKYPQPKTPDIQCLCKIFKVSANGVDIFCKVPTISNLQLTNGKSINSGSF